MIVDIYKAARFGDTETVESLSESMEGLVGGGSFDLTALPPFLVSTIMGAIASQEEVEDSVQERLKSSPENDLLLMRKILSLTPWVITHGQLVALRFGVALPSQLSFDQTASFSVAKLCLQRHWQSILAGMIMVAVAKHNSAGAFLNEDTFKKVSEMRRSFSMARKST